MVAGVEAPKAPPETVAERIIASLAAGLWQLWQPQAESYVHRALRPSC